MATQEKLLKKCAACKWAMGACFALALGLIVTAFFIPPTAEIHASVLKAVGEIWAFAALAFGSMAITYGYDLKIAKGDTEVTLNNDDQPSK